MEDLKVTSKATEREVSFSADFGTDLNDAIARFGEEAVWENYVAECRIKAGALARLVLNDPEKTPEDAVAAGVSYVPGATRPRTAAVSREKAFETLAKQVQSGQITVEELIARVTGGKTA